MSGSARTLTLPATARTAALLALAQLAALGCADEVTRRDAGAADAEVDAGLALDAEVTSDAGTSDAAPSEDAGPGVDAGTTADAGASGALTAVLDARCSWWTRRALIEVSVPGGPTRWLSASADDRPPPWLGVPESSDAACAFHRAWRGACSCTGDQVCDHDGACATLPTPAASVTVDLDDGRTTQHFAGDGLGVGTGEIVLAGDALSMRVVIDGLEVDVPAMRVPDELLGASGRLSGTTDQVQAIDLAWTVPAAGAEVYSLTRMNHHVPEATFTECVVPAASGSLHIDGAMLQPLAVATGLEFQGIQHVRFAAVEAPGGCVEVRFSRPQFLLLDF